MRVILPWQSHAGHPPPLSLSACRLGLGWMPCLAKGSSVSRLPIRAKHLALVHISWNGSEGHADRRIHGLCFAAALLQGQLHRLRKAWVSHFVVQHVHDHAEVCVQNVLAIDSLHDPATLHTC